MSRICQVVTKSQGAVPILLNFENGTILPNKMDISCNVIRDTNNGKDYLVSSSNSTVYKGQVETFQSTVPLIAVRNRTTNKVKLIEIERCILAPILNGELNSSYANKSRKEMLSMLNKTFGSKRAKRQTELRERMAVNVNEIEEQLERTIKTVTVNPDDLKIVSEADSLSGFLPPLHRDASSIDKVFLLNEIIDPEVLDTLITPSNEILAMDPEKIKANGLVLPRILELQQDNSETAVETCAVLLYIDSLVNYFVANYRDISKKSFCVCSHSLSVNKHILNNFTMSSATGRTRPNSMRDKTLAYIIALSLLSNGNKVFVEDIAKALKLGAKKIIDLARVIGVSSGIQQGAKTLFLRLPLPVSAPASKGKRRGLKK